MSLWTQHPLIKINKLIMRGDFTMEKLVYDMKELCTMLGVSKSAIYAFMERGELKAIRGSKKILFPRKAVDDFLNTAK